MEPATHDHQQSHLPITTNDNQELGKNTNPNNNFLCRQSSTRWTPTSEQIRILKELYYNNGVRSPSAEQIQRISAKLRQYGKIEGKNVFYWFQNHKARERQKKRFTAENHHHHHLQFGQHGHVISGAPMHRASSSSSNSVPWKNSNGNHEDHFVVSTQFYGNNKFLGSSINGAPPVAGNFPSSSNSAPGLLPHMGNYAYGSMAMEKSFRECSITANGAASMAGTHSFAWVGTVNDPLYPFLEKRKYAHQTLHIDDEDQDQDGGGALPEILTLPLFPMHGGEFKNEETSDYFNGWHFGADDSLCAGGGGGGGARASLELTLNSRFCTTSP